MEALVYRKPEAHLLPSISPIVAQSARESRADVPVAAPEVQPLSPAYFYPLIAEQEMLTWTHWLPTVLVFYRHRMFSPSEIAYRLRSLNAPAEVIEELKWSWKMELFDTYEIRTPVRRDARDPLLVGCIGNERYRLALWGESLLPLEKITDLVQQSLAIKNRATLQRKWLLLGSIFLGLAFGLWLGPTLLDTDASSAGIIFALLSFFAASIPSFTYTPENRQHSFLDRYRC